MAPEDRPQQPPKKVVAKKVVKKTVARPSAPVPPPSAIQIGRTRKGTTTPAAARPAKKAAAARPVAQPQARKTSKKSPSVGRPDAPAVDRGATTTVERPPREVGRKAGAAGRAIGTGTGRVAGAAGQGMRRGAGALGRGVSGAFWRVVDWRPPAVPAGRAGAVVGLVVGAFTVLVVAGFKIVFQHARGTSTGGGHWGFWTDVLVTIVAVLLGEAGLRALHVEHARATSLVAVFATIVLVLLVFESVVDSAWAWAILPPLGAVTYAVSARVLAEADDAARVED